MSEQDLRRRQPGTAVANSSGNAAMPSADSVSVEPSDGEPAPAAPSDSPPAAQTDSPPAGAMRPSDTPAARPGSRRAGGQRRTVDLTSPPAADSAERTGGAGPAAAHVEQPGSSRGTATPAYSPGAGRTRQARPPSAATGTAGSATAPDLSVRPGAPAAGRTATPGSPAAPPVPGGADRADRTERPLPPPPERDASRPDKRQPVPPRPSLFKRARQEPGGPGEATGRSRLAAAAEAIRRVATPPPAARPVRQARLRVTHLSPRTVFRITFLYSLCLFVVGLVAVAAFWSVLKTAGVFDSIVEAAQNITDKQNGGIGPWLSFPRVMLLTVLAGGLQVILFTLFNTIGALLYNLCADVVGGVEVTLSERD